MKQQAKNAAMLHRQAMTALAGGALAEGITLLQRIVAASAGTSEIHNDLGVALLQSGRLQEAEQHFARAAELAPANHHAALNLARLLRKTRGPAAAQKALERALEANDAAPLWAEHGLLLAAINDRAGAIYSLQKSIARDPAPERTWVSLLHYLEAENRLGEARETLASAKQAFPASPEIALQAAKLDRRAGKVQEALAHLERFQTAISPKSPYYSAFFFELGRLYDRADDADRAFAALQRANAAQAQMAKGRATGKDEVGKVLAHLRETFTPALATGAAPPLADGMPQPVFLIGFPRSGTTLLDQVLSSCEGVLVAEEKGAVNEMITRLGDIMCEKTGRAPAGGPLGFWQDAAYPGCLAALDAEDIARLREAYFAEHSRHLSPQGCRVFVDKLPLNIMHAGLILRVFPGARFILALRHPCDAVLSCFMQGFGVNQAMAHFHDLGDAARLYADVFALWDHYAQVLHPDAHAIRYEDVVSDFRTPVEDLLSFLGLAWDDKVLEFDKTARERGGINTPSYHQVTEKIYTRASGRWQRYRAHMEPVLGILAPHAERLGYRMD